LKIVEACFTPSLGGLELYCLNTAQQLAERGHRIELWLASGSRMAGHPIAAAMGTREFREPGYVDPFFARKATQILRDQKIDVVHLHRSKDLAAFSWTRPAAKVLTIQIDSSLKKRDFFHRLVFSQADRILTITERMRRLALQSLPVHPEKIFSLHYGIRTEEPQKAGEDGPSFRRRHGIPDDALLIGLVGRLERGKGQWMLLEAFAGLYSQYPDVHVAIVGEPPPGKEGYDRELKARAEELVISDRVHFTGFISQPVLVYQALDICVLGTKKESFGLVLLEAMVHGTPIIATDAGGVPEIIEHDLNGLLIPPENGPALAEAMRRLIEDAPLRRRLATEGKRIVGEKFNLDLHLDRLTQHFEKAVRLRQKRRRK
jgi:glycosyltransferase involved in cell wall biosynthesis